MEILYYVTNTKPDWTAVLLKTPHFNRILKLQKMKWKVQNQKDRKRERENEREGRRDGKMKKEKSDEVFLVRCCVGR